MLLTYEGHYDGVVSVDQAGASATPEAPVPSEAVVLKPLDTIEIVLPLKGNVHQFMANDELVDGIDGVLPLVSGTYLIEPDGNVALPKGLGRVSVAGKTEAEAGLTIRGHLVQISYTRTAHPFSQGLPPRPSDLSRGQAAGRRLSRQTG